MSILKIKSLTEAIVETEFSFVVQAGVEIAAMFLLQFFKC